MFSFKNKSVIITGGTGGLGRAICIEFAKLSANIIVGGRREKEGEETVHLINENGGKGKFIKCDVTQEADIKNLVLSAVNYFGKLDIAINNSGIIGKNKLIYQYTDEDFDSLMNVNLKGLWYSLKAEVEEMLKAKSGVILNISSVSGLIGFPYNSLYSASKHAVIGLTKSAALEFGHKGIRINAICPGGIQTEMLNQIFEATGKPEETMKNMTNLHSLRRLATPEEIAKSVVWLCSDSASFIHGSALPVDGGWTAH